MGGYALHGRRPARRGRVERCTGGSRGLCRTSGLVGFIENRCRYHNEWLAERDGSAYIYRGSAAAAWAKILLMWSTMAGGVATNVLLELVLGWCSTSVLMYVS